MTTLKELKSILRFTRITSWTEAGQNIITLGDKLIDKSNSFSRLDFYDKYKTLHFVERESQLRLPCGTITLANKRKIFYNIHPDKQSK